MKNMYDGKQSTLKIFNTMLTDAKSKIYNFLEK